ncbi:unnamed protein product [Amoebophrya sp. A25]|nr:unnamed protein product [Amoebophrya sp. A25]|eukprot:GSA25T00024287001.1
MGTLLLLLLPSTSKTKSSMNKCAVGSTTCRPSDVLALCPVVILMDLRQIIAEL